MPTSPATACIRTDRCRTILNDHDRLMCRYRSRQHKSPELVLQEIWGHLCCHYAIRTLMWEAAHHGDVDPDRVSFVAALRIARRSIWSGARFSPSDH